MKMSTMKNKRKAHNPLIFKDNDKYFLLSTDLDLEGVQYSTSRDLLSWSKDKVLIRRIPESIIEFAGNTGFWAPELVKRGNEYRLYVSSSSFGSQQSVISLFKSSNLDEDFQYVDNVVLSLDGSGIEEPNAIDANVVQDKNGQDFIIYGSFFGGIYIKPLDKNGLAKG